MDDIFSCEDFCPVGTYGYHCEHECSCQNGAVCSPQSGYCNCTAGMRHCKYTVLSYVQMCYLTFISESFYSKYMNISYVKFNLLILLI